MSDVGVREKVRFVSDGEECVGWHYAGTNGGCVVMAGGGGVTKEPGTDLFAARFHAAGFSVLAFDFRHLGESAGSPRQVIRIAEQLADWNAAIACAAELPEVDPTRIAGWSFSLSAGHLLRIAAGPTRLAAVIAQSPMTDNLVAAPKALSYESPVAVLGFPLLALADAIGGLLGRPPQTIPLAAPRGRVALLNTPDAQDGDRALNPGNRYPDWQQTIAARSVLPLMLYRPARTAARIRIPLMMIICSDDRSVLAAPALRAAERIPHAELLKIPGGHYAPFLDEHERTVEAELAFLGRVIRETAHSTDG
ncbi:alpha/beta hydrolase [Microlunatus soli]|uniref:Pimeloyl-ACP methyl ester carboxylesterase n=1 Tax=Microlunatus soli TaxID=630515 RepID=A0A1H1ZHW4_9ACTN|nr:alpha/beta hydrolase [Microlunatus soli]SDT33381.1 Pimeloyl-ACP methyl ester carboxylesterase [Microlunatus soli]